MIIDAYTDIREEAGGIEPTQVYNTSSARSTATNMKPNCALPTFYVNITNYILRKRSERLRRRSATELRLHCKLVAAWWDSNPL